MKSAHTIPRPDEPVDTVGKASLDDIVRLYREVKGAEAPLLAKSRMFQIWLDTHLQDKPVLGQIGKLSDDQKLQLALQFAGQTPTCYQIQHYILKTFGIDLSQSACSRWAAQFKRAKEAVMYGK